MKNYIKVKVTVWHKLHYTEQANMPGLADIIHENGLEEVIDDKLGFLESEILYDTENRLQPAGNDNRATIEVYADGKKIWTNETK
ncbi:MAG: hypothetical protein QM768_12225 [Agriterribacter sp.]